MKPVLIAWAIFWLPVLSFGQYTVNGNAFSNNCHCYTLTPNSFTQSGSVWNNIKIDLRQSFDFNFNINLGCNDAGADGIAFVMQPISTSVGTTGGGLGYEGISPAVGITIDTWQNTPNSDPSFDHIAIQLNGNIDHANPVTNIAGPVTVLAGNNNIEDCITHRLRVTWDAASFELNAYVDGDLRVGVIKNLVSDVFGGNPLVFWGFTGSTGGASNLQQFCTALTPAFKFLPAQKRCINEPISFFDSTVSFTQVLKMYWDFGDGSNIDSVNANPVHTYSSAGDYTVTQTVIGADGCTEVNTQSLRIGSIPVADFSPNSGCASVQLQLQDQSSVGVGTITGWNWNLGSPGTSTVQQPTAVYNAGGQQTISLAVKTVEGCESAPVTKTIMIFPSPVAAFAVTGNLCQGAPVQFTNQSVVNPGAIAGTSFSFGNGQLSAQPNPVALFDSAKNYTVTLAATSDQGCTATTSQVISIHPKPVALFGASVTGCAPTVVNLQDSSYSDSGAQVDAWWWNTGVITSQLQHPTLSFNNGGSVNISLVVSNSNGCLSDTAKKVIQLPSRPVAVFGYPSPLCSGAGSARFTDSSFSNGSAVQSWQWLADGIPVSNDPSPVIDLAAGNHFIQLLVTNTAGCSSLPAVKNVTVFEKPVINIQVTDACAGNPARFTASTGAAVQGWRWDFGDGSVATSQDTLHTYAVSGAYPVSLQAVSTYGCVGSDSAGVNIYSTNALVNRHSIIAAVNEPVQLIGSGGVSYQWSPAAGLSDPAIANPVATNTEDRQYTLKAYTSAGCETYDTVLIRILNGPEIYVPTAFNPLSSMGNNLLKAIPVGISRFGYFNVYNRLGQLVFSTSDPGRGWDGSFKGKPQNSGAYTWVAQGTSFRGTAISRKGMVLLLR